MSCYTCHDSSTNCDSCNTLNEILSYLSSLLAVTCIFNLDPDPKINALGLYPYLEWPSPLFAWKVIVK